MKHTEGALLLLAGAGTGKTKALTTRLAYIIDNQLCRPWQLLAVTFTNKAAREMRERVAQLVGEQAQDMWLGTFHAISVKILRRHAERVGRTSQFTILDADDQQRLLKQLIKANNIDEKRFPPRRIMGMIQRWKDKAWRPEDVPPRESNMAEGKALRLYKEYQQRLQTINSVDFGDLLMLTVHLLRENADVLDEYHRKFKYVLVDEYQDTNAAQYLWLRLLAQGSGNICCVGDDDQSIYGWRGAEVENILRFEREFPEAKVIRLEQNYRSTEHILGAAHGIIAKNGNRLGKKLWTDKNGGEAVVIKAVWDGQEEARQIADEIERIHHQENHSLNEVAILVRAGYQTREFEERFLTIGLPYRIVGGLRFYERQEIKDALAYLQVVAQPRNDMAFERIINKPKRGIGLATIQSLYAEARQHDESLIETVQRGLQDNTLPSRARKPLTAFMQDYQRWRTMAAEMVPHELMGMILDESGYTAMWKNDDAPDAPGRLENLKELINSMEAFDTLNSFLEHASLVADAGQEQKDEDKITMMTLHAAKGLEFDTVFLPGWEEGIFPNPRALDDNGQAGLEEERRLAYVGITRARKQACITYAGSRRVYGECQNLPPSRFIDEFPEEHVTKYNQPNMQTKPAHSWSVDLPEWGDNPARKRLKQQIITIASKAVTANGIATGSRIFHQKFGYGQVMHASGEKLDVKFDKAGNKKVMAGFVELA